MIGANVPIYVAVDPVDMKKSFDTLALAVREQLGHDPESGALYVFAGRGASPTGLRPLPEHLPVETIMLVPAEVQGPERDAYECLGEEVSETLEHGFAGKVRVRVVRPKFARKGESAAGVITAPPLEMPIDKGPWVGWEVTPQGPRCFRIWSLYLRIKRCSA